MSEARASRVVVAGAGVAGLEAVLALGEHDQGRLDVTLLAPESDFRYRQLSVVSPFERLQPEGVSLDEITRDLGVRHRRGEIESIDVAKHSAQTRAGNTVDYDFLLLAVGCAPEPTVPGSLCFRGLGDETVYRRLLESIDAGSTNRIAFAVPSGSTWSLPIYELAFLTAEHATRNGRAVSLEIVSPEVVPLAALGDEASDGIATLLAAAGIDFAGSRRPVGFASGTLELEGGERRPYDSVVSIAVQRPPLIGGLPRDARGYVPTDAFGRVVGAADVFAAGDITSFPVEQGGLAAQQADVAAATIAAEAGGSPPPAPFTPVLRAVLITPWGPRYLRSGPHGESVISRSQLWHPPTKVAGRLLGPYLAQRSGRRDNAAAFADLEPLSGDRATAPESGHEDAFALALDAAELAATRRDFAQALAWLGVAEDLELRLPQSFQARRIAWRELAGPGR